MSIDFIKKEMTLKQPIDKVWRAITEPTSVSKWFGSDAQYQLEKGAVGYFEWQNMCAGRYAMQIVDIKPQTYFAWRWMFDKDVAFDEAQSTLVEWTLKPTLSGKTHLILIESGFTEEHRRKMNIQGWNEELQDLAAFLQS